MGTSVLIFFVTLSSVIITCFCLNCLSPTGKPVDWFIIYKVPDATKPMPVKKPNTEFYYMDSFNPTFSFMKVDIQRKEENPLFKTLEQIYDGRAQVYAMYNDQIPPGKKCNKTTLVNNTIPHGKSGHMKGAYAFDEKEGFWMISSIPAFPAPRKQGYRYCESQLKYGQSVLCVTLEKKSLTGMRKIFALTKPTFYDGNDTLAKKEETYHRSISETSIVVPFNSTGNQMFKSFAKSAEFGKDLYDSLVAVKLKDNLYVETHQGSLSLNCSTHYKVYNVKKVQFDNGSYWFPSTMDHAKWAVAEKKPWTCIGDINRRKTQFERGGGTMCLYHKEVASQFIKLLKESEKCV